MDELWPAVVQYVIPALITALIPIVGLAVRALASKWTAEGSESKGKAVAARLLFLTDAIVADLNASLKDELIAASADGTIDDAEKAALKAHAMDRIKATLTERGVKEVATVFGILAPSVDTLLSGLIEKSVAASKK